MRIIEEMERDMDFRKPRVTATENFVILESVKEIVLVSPTAVAVKNAQRYVSVSGEGFVLREIGEGRIVVEGRLREIEFL